jgi:hypothetical protein
MPREFFTNNRPTYPPPLLCLAAWLVCLATPLGAAAPAEALPSDGDPAPSDSASHWRKPPAHSRWEITFESNTSATGSARSFDIQYRPHRVTVTRHGKDMLQEVLMEDGKRWETWSLGPIQIQSIGGQDAVWLRPPPPKGGGTSEQTDYHSFREFHWLRKEHFRGTFPVLGVRAAVYLFPLADTSSQALTRLRAAPRGPLGALPLCEGVLAAAIHPETKYPLLLQQGAQLRMYSVSPLPQGPLLLPDKVTRFRQFLAAPARVAPRPLP